MHVCWPSVSRQCRGCSCSSHGFSDRWDLVWQGNWIWPLLGIIFLPYTLVMYMLSFDVLAGSVTGWGWMWIGFGVLLDIMKWGSIYERRQEIPYASQYTGVTD